MATATSQRRPTGPRHPTKANEGLGRTTRTKTTTIANTMTMATTTTNATSNATLLDSSNNDGYSNHYRDNRYLTPPTPVVHHNHSRSLGRKNALSYVFFSFFFFMHSSRGSTRLEPLVCFSFFLLFTFFYSTY